MNLGNLKTFYAVKMKSFLPIKRSKLFCTLVSAKLFANSMEEICKHKYRRPSLFTDSKIANNERKLLFSAKISIIGLKYYTGFGIRGLVNKEGNLYQIFVLKKTYKRKLSKIINQFHLRQNGIEDFEKILRYLYP